MATGEHVVEDRKPKRHRLARILRWTLGLGTVFFMVLALTALFLWSIPSTDRAFFPFPAHKACAIAITDDTDYFKYETAGRVYTLLNRLGLRITKTVWAYDVKGWDPAKVGPSLADPGYRSWVLEQSRRGHEITLHSATCTHDTRETTLAAYSLMRNFIDTPPRVEIFHSNNKEALYWGGKRLPNPLLRWLYLGVVGVRFEGDEENSPYYWLDRSRQLVRYVRTYTFAEVNTLAVNPTMPFEDARTPQAPLWFASSNGRTADEFVDLLRPGNIERLKSERGTCVVYTHFGLDNFTDRDAMGDQRLRPDVRETLERCGNDPAVEFVPAGELLDRLRVIQILEDALSAGRRAVIIPSDLLGILDGISIDPSRLPPAFVDPHANAALGSAGQRLPASRWISQAGIELTGGETSVFENTHSISWRERWRLVLRWLMTQVTSPT